MPQPRGWPICGKRARRPAAWSFGIAVLAMAANPAPAQTLTEALAYAYQNNPQLLAQRASLRASDEEVPIALSGWRPTVNVTTQSGFNRSALTARGLVTGTPTTVYDSFYNRSVQLQATQPVYRGGRT